MNKAVNAFSQPIKNQAIHGTKNNLQPVKSVNNLKVDHEVLKLMKFFIHNETRTSSTLMYPTSYQRDSTSKKDCSHPYLTTCITLLVLRLL